MSAIFEVPKGLKEQQGELLADIVKKKGKIRIGINEVTKAVEREKAQLVVIANDVSPAEITMHLPALCREKKIPFTFIDSRKELGEKIGVSVGSAAIAIVDAGDTKSEFEKVVRQVQELNK
jgi:large subunit ribosomal protein L7Ae